ncbi:DUF2007 domain-containing protein [Thermodesulfovibrionales bacterium]|nr:DUF2007 domain-containing protein [Thermodesulfovibrionales bacterium]
MNEEWVVVSVIYDPLEAEMIKSLLESGGVPVVLRSSRVGIYPLNIKKMGETEILVREEDKEIAEKIAKG